MPPEQNQNFNNPVPQQPIPEKKSSGLNTILLILLIALVGFGIWMISNKLDEKNTNTNINTQVPIQEEQVNQEPVVNQIDEPDSVNSKTSVLRNLLIQYPKSLIRECFFEDKTYFSFDSTIMADGPTVIYDMNGDIAASGGGFVPNGTQFSPEYTNIISTCTTTVYKPYFHDDYSGTTSQEIDVYNVY